MFIAAAIASGSRIALSPAVAFPIIRIARCGEGVFFQGIIRAKLGNTLQRSANFAGAAAGSSLPGLEAVG